MGTYQFAVQYADSVGDGYTSYYGITNPIGIFENKTSQDFNLPTSKSITIEIDDLDTTGLYEYFNIAVIKTINNTTTVELVGTFPVAGATINKENNKATYKYTYTGSDVAAEQLTTNDIFEKFPYYDTAQDIFEVDNILGWDNLTKFDDINYQQVWSKVNLLWETHRVPYNKFEAYNNGLNTATLRGYMRDEVYAFEGCFILKNGEQTKSFHIPGRLPSPKDHEVIPVENKDSNALTSNPCETPVARERWEVYNTASKIDFSPAYADYIATHDPTCYEVVESTTGNIIDGTVTLNCDSVSCEQGEVSLTVNLNNPAPTTLKLQIGFIINGLAAGWDIYSIPNGVQKHNYYFDGSPFEVTIPQGQSYVSLPWNQVYNGHGSLGMFWMYTYN